MPRLPVGHRSKAIQTSGRYLTPVQNAVYALPSRSESGGLACLKSLSVSYRTGWRALAWLKSLLTSVFEVSVARVWLTGEPFRVSQLAEVRVLLPAPKRCAGSMSVCSGAVVSAIGVDDSLSS
jgi:hypothetical protein